MARALELFRLTQKEDYTNIGQIENPFVLIELSKLIQGGSSLAKIILESMAKDFRNSLNTLEKKKLIMSQHVADNNGQVRDKLNEILHGMSMTQKLGFDRHPVLIIDENYIKGQIKILEKNIGNVFGEKIKTMIIKTITVF
jgi:hypothetical protein